MADYIESWRTRQRANQVISALRKITKDKRATVGQKLEACKLLVDLERERAQSDANRLSNKLIQKMEWQNVPAELLRPLSSNEINNLAPNSSND